MKAIILFFFCISSGFDILLRDHTSAYHNTRYDYLINYPEDILFPQREAENGDGRIFLDSSGVERLRVFGSLNRDKEGNQISLKEKFGMEMSEFARSKKNVVVYKLFKNDYFVFSGVKDGCIYYSKVIKKKDAFATAVMQYSAAEKAEYDKVIEKIMKSFR